MTIALEDTIALVTGAGGGIGSATVSAMKEAGATVIATDLGDIDVGADHTLSLDVTNADDWAKAADLVADKFGRLDALVHNAGLSVVGKFEDLTLTQFHKVNSINVDAAIIGTQALLEMLKAGGKHRAGGASVVNVSSVGGLRGAAFNAAYCTSKAAIKMLAKCMGAEFGALGYNIRVNSVHPGGIDTGMLNSIFERYVELGAAESVEAAGEGVIASHPIGRIGKPEEIAGGIVFLCSDAASFMTCDELVIDGGFTQV